MFRLALSLLVGLFFFGSASAESLKHSPAEIKAKFKAWEAKLEAQQAQFEAQRQAKAKALDAQRHPNLKADLEAAKIPAVSLSEKQIATLKATAPKNQLAVWYRAGRQSDGKTFVCLVTSGKALFAHRAQVFAGTFESDGSFQQTLAQAWSSYAVRDDCRKRGFDPPVTISGGLGF
jgi:hypothetical protein